MIVTRISRSVWTSALQAFLVAASIPSGWAAAPLFTYVSGPTGCTQPSGYPDAALCTVPNETPLGTLPLPAVGGTYVDGNFGATVKLISSFSTNHGYSTTIGIQCERKICSGGAGRYSSQRDRNCHRQCRICRAPRGCHRRYSSLGLV